MSIVVLLLPLFLLLLFILALALIVFKKWKLALACLVVLCVINVYYEVIPINLFSKNERKGISLITYNINSSNSSFSSDSTLQSRLLSNLLEEEADIVVLNEYYKRYCTEEFHSGLFNSYPYYYREKNGSPNVIFSKYPIVQAEEMFVEKNSELGQKINNVIESDSSRFYKEYRCLSKLSIETPNGDLGLYPCHLTSPNFDRITKYSDKYSNLWKRFNAQIDSYKAGELLRLCEAEWLLDRINNRPKSPTLICGDFNEVSGGRSIKLIQSEANLIDAWWEKGCGLGLTYHGHKIMHFRLDHVLHSKEISINSIEVLDWNYSDHKPLMITFDIKRKDNE